MRQNDTRHDVGKGSMTMERAAQQEGRAILPGRPRVRLSWRWAMLAFGVILMASVSKSGRTFASLVVDARGGTSLYAATSLSVPSPFREQTHREFASRELELLRSIELGELAHAEALLAAGISANTKDQHGWTPLMLAALHNRLTLIPVLSANGADPNAHNVKGTTALMLAANNGHREMVRLLLDRGAQVNAKTAGGWTALMYAAWKGHSAIAADLLRTSANPAVTDSQHWTALMYATWQGHTETVKVFLESQERNTVREKERKQARVLAEQQGHAEIVRLLKQMETRG